MQNSPLTPSPWLYDCLKAQLPFRPTAYREHRRGRWVIGYDHRADVSPGDTCTMAMAEQWLRDDIAAAAASIADPRTQGELDVAVVLRVAGL